MVNHVTPVLNGIMRSIIITMFNGSMTLKLRRIARYLGFDPRPQSTEEAIEVVCLYPDRYFQEGGKPLEKEEVWGGLGSVLTGRVTLRIGRQELGWIEDVQIKERTAFFGHFAIDEAWKGTGLAQVMMNAFLARLVELYAIESAVFDMQRIRSRNGDYKRFLTKRLAAVQNAELPNQFTWRPNTPANPARD